MLSCKYYGSIKNLISKINKKNAPGWTAQISNNLIQHYYVIYMNNIFTNYSIIVIIFKQ